MRQIKSKSSKCPNQKKKKIFDHNHLCSHLSQKNLPHQRSKEFQPVSINISVDHIIPAIPPIRKCVPR